MDPADVLLSLPVNLETWLILAYVAVVLAGARLSETLARLHFDRARRYAEGGFEYDADADHYHCPQGERLALHMVEEENRLAVYRAPASSCNDCALKTSCTPHDEGRHLYRPLAEWAETDIGRFHRRLSLLMTGVGLLFSLGGVVHWMGQPGTGLLLLALMASLTSMTRELRATTRMPYPTGMAAIALLLLPLPTIHADDWSQWLQIHGSVSTKPCGVVTGVCPWTGTP